MISEQAKCHLVVRERVDLMALPNRVYALATGWREIISCPGWEMLIASESYPPYPFLRLHTFFRGRSYDSGVVLSRIWAGSWAQIQKLASIPDVRRKATVDLSGILAVERGLDKRWREGVTYTLEYDEFLLLCLFLPKCAWARMGIGKDSVWFDHYASGSYREIVYESGVFGWSILTSDRVYLPDGILERTHDFLVHLLGFAETWSVERTGTIIHKWVLSWKAPDNVVVGDFSLSPSALNWTTAEKPTGVSEAKIPDTVVRCTTQDEIWPALLAMQRRDISKMYWVRAERVPLCLDFFPEVGLMI